MSSAQSRTQTWRPTHTPRTSRVRVMACAAAVAACGAVAAAPVGGPCRSSCEYCHSCGTCIGQATLTGALFPACSPPGAPQPRGGAAAHHPAGPHPADPGAPDARQCEPAAVATAAAAAAAAAMTAPQYLPYLAPSPASMHANPGTAPSQPPCRPTLGTQTPTQSLTTPCWVSGRRWRGRDSRGR